MPSGNPVPDFDFNAPIAFVRGTDSYLYVADAAGRTIYKLYDGKVVGIGFGDPGEDCNPYASCGDGGEGRVLFGYITDMQLMDTGILVADSGANGLLETL